MHKIDMICDIIAKYLIHVIGLAEATMSLQVVLIFLLFSTFSSLQSLFICHQLTLKPPGQSTVIDLIIRDFLLNIIFSNSLIGLTLLSGIVLTLPNWYIVIFICLFKQSSICVILEWLAMSLLRYCYIFHWTAFSDIEDSKIHFAARAFYIALGLILNCSELFISSRGGDFKANYKVRHFIG